MPPAAGSAANNPIILSEDGIGEVLSINIEDLDADSDDDLEIIAPAPPKKKPIELKNRPPQYPWTSIKIHMVQHKIGQLGPTGARIKVGDTVEVESAGSRNRFLRVFDILENVVSGKVRLRGLLFKRPNSIAPLLNLKLNEVFLHARIYAASIDKRPCVEQGLEEVPVEDFVRKRSLTLTNKTIEEFSWRTWRKLNSRWSHYEKCKQEIRDEGLLCCRYAFIQTFDQKMGNAPAATKSQNEFRPLTVEESDEGGGDLKAKDQQANTSEGRLDGSKDLASPVDAQQPASSPLKRRRGEEVDQPYDEGMKRHTFGDVFCGAGGASCGAKMAGLKVEFGVDNNKDALNSYMDNFRNALTFPMSAHDFFKSNGQIPNVDILHLSPPCQYFSQAHTTEGRNDEQNESAIFSIGPLVKRVKPRIVTLEETSGILRNQHVGTFYQALSELVSEGYSLRWASLPCLVYGCPQPRKRLFLLASAPGVPLPRFPEPTHGPRSLETREKGLLPFTTLRLAVTHIPENATLHDPENESRLLKEPREPLDPDECSKRTMLTNNESSFYHWTGKRRWTLREMACLQGFPTSHQFSGPPGEIRRQIGNAVPPNVMRLFFAQCIAVLKRVDAQKAARPRHVGPVTGPVIDLVMGEDEDEDGDNVIPSIETAQEKETEAPTYPPLAPTRGVCTGMQPRDDSMTIDRETEAPVELADQDDSSDAAPVPGDFNIWGSSSPRGSDSGSGTFGFERSPSTVYATPMEHKGADTDSDVVDKDKHALPGANTESSSPGPAIAARGMMRSMSLQAAAIDDEGDMPGGSRSGDPVYIVIDDE